MKTKDDRIKEYRQLVISIKMSYLISIIPYLDVMGYFDQPASTRFHGAYEGGLFDHSLEVAKALMDLTDKLNLQWDRPASPLIIGLFHDLCKCDNYVFDRESNKYISNPDMIIPGHGDKSLIMLQQLLPLTDEEIACIRWHMGAYETDTKMWNYYGQAIEKYPNVLYTHMADMIASKIKGV